MAWLRCEHTENHTETSFSLRKPLTTIGSADGNDLVLKSIDVDATHASIVRAGSRYTINMMGKRGFQVNGRAKRVATLSAGDRVVIGPFSLTFAEGSPIKSPIKQPDAAPLNLLQGLVELSTGLINASKPDLLFKTILKNVVKLTRAEKGFVIVFQNSERHLAASYNLQREHTDLSTLSDSIIERVCQTREPLIISDALQDARFGSSKSVVDLKLSSVMCVPMIVQKEMIGAIYLGNDSITGLFTQANLDLLTVYAAQAALITHHALLFNQLKLDNRNLRDQLTNTSQGEMIGSSDVMKSVFKMIRRVAPTDLSVLILGETGTGKELVAKELHACSERGDQPFVAINCGAIPEHLLESELFGHKKGAFTGAIADKIGKIETANGGTLFLDEIGEMPMNLQVKLLRVLQERVIERVGDLKSRPLNVRVLAATNRGPDQMISEGIFREDLYYRLNEISIVLPPLREREQDIPLLAHYLLHKFRVRYASKAHAFSKSAITAIQSYRWPGNVRELENKVKKALIMSDRGQLSADDLGLSDVSPPEFMPLAEAQEHFKINYIKKVLAHHNGNKAATARALHVDARTIFRSIERREAQ